MLGDAGRELTRVLAAQQGQEFVDLDAYPIDYEVAFMLSRGAAEMYCALPLRRDGSPACRYGVYGSVRRPP